MPQKYQVELPDGSHYEIEQPDEKTNHIKSAATGVVKGVGDVTGVGQLVEAGKVAHDVAPDILANIKSGAQSLGKTITEFGLGAIESPMAKAITRAINPASMSGRPQALPTREDIDPAAHTDDPYEANARRVTNVAGLVLGAKLLGGKKGPGKMAPSVGEFADTAAVTGTGAYPQRPALIKNTPPPTQLEVPVVPQQARTGSSTATGSMKTAAPVSVSSVKGGAVTGPKVSMSVPVKAKPPVVADVAPLEPPASDVSPRATETHNPNNGAMKAEAAAEAAANGKTEPAGRKPAYEGMERREPTRKQGEAIDRAYKDVRKEQERKALVAEARKRLGATKPPATAIEPPAPPPDATPVPEEGIAPPSSTIGLDEPVNMTPGKPGEVIRIGYDKPKTKTLYRVEPKDLGDKGEWLKKSLTPEQFAKFQSERGRLFGDDLSKLENYGHGADTHNTFSVDVPESDAASWGRQHPDGFTEYVVPEEVVGRKQPYKAPSSPATASAVPEGSEGAPAVGEPPAAPAKPKLGQSEPKSGMSTEVVNRLAAGETLNEIAADLRDKLGSKRAAAQMGRTPEEVKVLSGGGPSRIPANAVEKIKAALSAKAEAGSLDPREQALWDRIKSERGAADIKKLLMLGGGVAGGAIGFSLSDDGDPTSDQSLLKTGLGMIGGAALPAAIMSPHVGRHMLGLRTEGFLSGAAIPKNILTDAAAPITAALEGSSTKGRMAPVKELFNLPENAKNFVSAMKNPASSNKYGKTAGPFSKTIGAIDTTGRKMLERGGVPNNEIDRLLLTADRSLFSGMKPSKTAQGVLDIAYPFQRVPANVFAETAEAAGRTAGLSRGPNGIEFHPRAKGAFANPDMKTALDLAAVGGGAALGEWAKGDKQKLYLATIAMAIMGPRAGLGTIGAMSRVGRQAIGGISPIPEQNADIKSFVGWPPTGWKMLQRLGIVGGGK